MRAAGSARCVAPFSGTVTPYQMKRIFTSVGRLVCAVPVGEEGEELAKSAMLSAMPFLDDEKRIVFRFLDGVSPGEFVRQNGLDKFRELGRHDLPIEDFFFQTLRNEAEGSQELQLKTGLSMLERLSPSTALRGSSSTGSTPNAESIPGSSAAPGIRSAPGSRSLPPHLGNLMTAPRSARSLTSCTARSSPRR